MTICRSEQAQQAQQNAKLKRLKTVFAAFFKVRCMEIDADVVRLWLDAFADLTPEQVEFAIREFNRNCSDFPTPAGVRAYAGAAGMSNADRAITAWRAVVSTMRTHGAYHSIEFDDPIIHAAVRTLGGWPMLCRTQRENMPHRQRDFVTEYVSIARSGVGDFRRLSGCLDHSPVFHAPTGLPMHSGLKLVAGSAVAKTTQRITDGSDQ